MPPTQNSSRRAVEDYVNSVQSKSSWATKAEDAHTKYMSEYSNQQEANQHLGNAVASH